MTQAAAGASTSGGGSRAVYGAARCLEREAEAEIVAQGKVLGDQFLIQRRFGLMRLRLHMLAIDSVEGSLERYTQGSLRAEKVGSVPAGC